MTRFVAEIGSNHNRDADRCLRLIRACAQAGCSAAKLQVFRVEDLFARDVLDRRPDLAKRRAWEFPLELLPDVRAECDRLGLELGATPFGLWAVERLEPWVDFLKVSSYELLWHHLIRECAGTGKPLVLSTGMATLEEVQAAVAVAREAGCRHLTLLHCVSGYPTPPEEANLSAIQTLRGTFESDVGWSDHTGVLAVIERAVRRWEASMVEVHVDIDGTGYEAGDHCWTPTQVARAIPVWAGTEPLPDEEGAVVDTAAIDGDGMKRPMPAELEDRQWRADPADGLRPLRSTRESLATR